LFSQLGNKNFTSWISSQLKPKFIAQGHVLYEEGNQIDGFYFMTKGVAAFVKPTEGNAIIGLIDPDKVLKTEESSLKVF
jgi:CRP-like cAMP-binding protein